MDLTQVLLNSQNADPRVRQEAEDFLNKCATENLPVYLVSLVLELGHDEKPAQSRQMAGLILKNQLVAREEVRRRQLEQQWLSQQPQIKDEIKKRVIETLGSKTKEARHTSAQVLAKIAAIEIPQQQWLEIITILLRHVTTPISDDQKEASLEALGYICEETDPDSLTQRSNEILTAVIQGMRSEEKNVDVRRAATTALYNALESVNQNMERANERDFIMKVVCEATQSTDSRIKKGSFECLVKITALYYEKLKPYMQALFQITVPAAQSGEEEVALQAIEFWSTMCDVEMEILDEIQDATDPNNPPSRVCENYVKAALPHLIPILLQLLTRQEEDQEDDDWNLSTASGTCLDLIARTVKNDIMQHVIPFVTTNVNHADWHFREASILAFGSILEGPSEEQMRPVVAQAIMPILQHINDAVTLVKDTTVWTLGRIAELYPKEMTTDEYLKPVLEKLLGAMNDEPSVACKCCWAVHNIASAFNDQDDNTPTNALSPYFEPIVRVILTVTERPDSNESNLRCSAYEALNVLLQTAARDSYKYVQAMVPVLITRLESTIKQGAVSSEDREQMLLVQGLLCGALQVVTRKLGHDIKPFSDKMMELFVMVFNSRSSTIQEETLMAVGALANAIEADFEKYMPTFSQYLHIGLRNVEYDTVVSIAVGVIGDLCGALNGKIAPYCDEIVGILLQDLQSELLNRNAKPAMFASFGDIALAIGTRFDKYLQYVCLLLSQAAATQVDPTDEELVDYLNMLRENIFEAYTGILQGFKNENANAFNPYVDGLLNFIRIVSQDERTDEAVFRNAVGVIGDLADVYGPKIKQHLNQDFIQQLVSEATKSNDAQTKETGDWVRKKLKALH